MAMSVDPLGSFERRQEAKLALAGYRKLYETQLRAERKSPKTIEVYRYVLERFERWFQAENGRAPVLAEETWCEIIEGHESHTQLLPLVPRAHCRARLGRAPLPRRPSGSAPLDLRWFTLTAVSHRAVRHTR